MSSADDRRLGALYGLAIGDALGMPTQLPSRDQVADHFGTIEGFREPPPDHGIAAELLAGLITTSVAETRTLAIKAAELGQQRRRLGGRRAGSGER